MLVLRNSRKVDGPAHLARQDFNAVCGALVANDPMWIIEIYRRGTICEHCSRLKWEFRTVDDPIWRSPRTAEY